MASSSARTPPARTSPPVSSLHWAALWPGLARLWLRGEMGGLVTAVAFALLLNFALVTTFVWPQLVSRQLPAWAVPAMAWIAVVWFWVAGLRAGGRVAVAVAKEAVPLDAESTALLQQAQLDYLKGHLIEAETCLRTLLVRTPGDVEGWLLLASVQRRLRQPAAAWQSLAKLAELPGSVVWGEEVQRELVRLQALERELSTRPAVVSKAA